MLKTLMATAAAAAFLLLSSPSFAQDGGVDGGKDASTDGSTDMAIADKGGEPDVVTPDQGGGGGSGRGFQDCTTDADCDDRLAEAGIDDPAITLICNDDGICEVQIDLVDECSDDTECCEIYGVRDPDCTAFYQCEAATGECREVDDRGVACVDDDDCPRNEPCDGEFCIPQGVACGRTDGCSELGRGGGCNVASGSSPFASGGLALLALAGLGLMVRRRTPRR